MKKHKPESEEAIKEVIKAWPDHNVRIVVDEDEPIVTLTMVRWVTARQKSEAVCLCVIDLRKLVKRRAPLIGIEKKLRKAIRPGKKR